MSITKLVLNNFRNFEELVIPFSSKTNVFIGRNGQGKSNLLESIYFIAFLRSFRTENLENLIKNGERLFYAGIEIFNTNFKGTLEATFKSKKKELKINKVYTKKASDFIGIINPVVFSHNDLNIIIGTSRLRRKNLDVFLSSIDREYFSDLQNYLFALRSKNALIRSGRRDINEYTSFEVILASYAEKISIKRENFITKVKFIAEKLFSKIKGDEYKFSIIYSSKLNGLSREDILTKIEKERERDFKRGYSCFGIHVDDLIFSLNGQDLKNFGSTGECRTASLCFKLAVSELITSHSIEKSIALIDDVTGELDESTKEAFYESILKFGQIFITSVDRRSILLEDASFFNIDSGTIS